MQGQGRATAAPCFSAGEEEPARAFCVLDAGERQTGTSSETTLCALAEQQEFRGLDHLLRKALALPSLCSTSCWEKPPLPKGNKIKSRREVLSSLQESTRCTGPSCSYVLQITKHFGSKGFPAKRLLLMSRSGRMLVTAVSSPSILA